MDDFLPGHYYHVFSRSVGTDLLFQSEENYKYFLQKFQSGCSVHFSTLAYCLLPNHFHFLLQVKEDSESQVALQAFSNFLNGYSKAYNKLYDRHGALFQRKFKRKKIDQDSYFSQVIIYIHQNPQKHGFANDFRSWRFSSYSSLLSQKPTSLVRSFVIDWFGGTEGFQKSHQVKQSDNLPEDFTLE